MFPKFLSPTRRNQRALLFTGAGIFTLIILAYSSHHLGYSSKAISYLSSDTDYPPRYDNVRESERLLPQHNLSLPFPEGKDGRYVKFSNQVGELGWNNALNELLMNSHLAYKSNRAYVFRDFVWKKEYYPWPEHKAYEWPPRTPLSALITGPTVGGSWGADDPAPRAISEKWFDVVCPPERRRIINTREVKPALAWLPGNEIFAGWHKLLLEAPENCIEIQPADRSEDGFPQVFDLWLWGSDRILSLWEEFKNSPVSQLLGPSAIIERNMDANRRLFSASDAEAMTTNPYHHMLAIHLRRGDYVQACQGLADWNSTFYSWNLQPFLPDKFTALPGGGWGKNTPENEALYMKHCLPSDDAILEKIRSSRDEYLSTLKAQGKSATVDVLYILTNDKSGWVEQVRDGLVADGWRIVVTSHDLQFDQEGKDVAMAIDMEIATQAAVFIGNGWSSFTSNIVHRRLVDGKIPMSIRFY